MPAGTVVAFDDAKGYGTVSEDGTAAEHFFHCTSIADGTRTIHVGAQVTFDIVPGRNGTWEARSLALR
jgi:CspA family cold shock protein